MRPVFVVSDLNDLILRTITSLFRAWFIGYFRSFICGRFWLRVVKVLLGLSGRAVWHFRSLGFSIQGFECVTFFYDSGTLCLKCRSNSCNTHLQVFWLVDDSWNFRDLKSDVSGRINRFRTSFTQPSAFLCIFNDHLDCLCATWETVQLLCRVRCPIGTREKEAWHGSLEFACFDWGNCPEL